MKDVEMTKGTDKIVCSADKVEKYTKLGYKIKGQEKIVEKKTISIKPKLDKGEE